MAEIPPRPWVVGPYGMVWVAADVVQKPDGRWQPTCEEPRIVFSLGTGESELGRFIVEAGNNHDRLTRENGSLRAIVTRLAEGERSDEGHTALRDAALALKEPGQ